MFWENWTQVMFYEESDISLFQLSDRKFLRELAKNEALQDPVTKKSTRTLMFKDYEYLKNR